MILKRLPKNMILMKLPQQFQSNMNIETIKQTNWGFYNPIVAITVMITKKCLEYNMIIS